MADGTKIEWTDATWNVVTGCDVVSPGCTNCYAMRLAGTRLRNHPSRAGLTRDSKAGPVWTGEVRFNRQWLGQPLKWARPRMIFVAAHGDLFHEGVEDAWLDQIFAVMALCPQHIFQVLTKRPERMLDYLTTATQSLRRRAIGKQVAALDLAPRSAAWERRANLFGESVPVDLWPLPNVWLGTSVEDQKRADERIPLLLDTPAAVRWISAEPLLGPVDLNSTLGGTLWMGGQRGCGGQHHGVGTRDCPRHLHHHHDERCRPGLDWVVAGGESGPGARPMHPDWVRSLRDQCAAAGVAFHFKQWGAWAAHPLGEVSFVDGSGNDPSVCWPDGTITHAGSADDHGGNGILIHPVGKERAGRLLDGVEHNGLPVAASTSKAAQPHLAPSHPTGESARTGEKRAPSQASASADVSADRLSTERAQ